ncbi:MBL fold metallo-hydrolase [Arthrobacter agilis]|nr:hypothetical protein CI784_00750 [Arthrobacter agilis]TPV25689.1 MBL fold metallo-hydrolase [Arthrobacter agilis]
MPLFGLSQSVVGGPGGGREHGSGQWDQRLADLGKRGEEVLALGFLPAARHGHRRVEGPPDEAFGHTAGIAGAEQPGHVTGFPRAVVEGATGVVVGHHQGQVDAARSHCRVEGAAALHHGLPKRRHEFQSQVQAEPSPARTVEEHLRGHRHAAILARASAASTASGPGIGRKPAPECHTRCDAPAGLTARAGLPPRRSSACRRALLEWTNAEEGCMDSTSTQQTDAIGRGELPPLDRVRDDVWSLAQPMPGGHLAYSFTYLLVADDGGVHVVDPGWDSDENWERLLAALAVVAPEFLGAAAVSGITGTHLHPDHVGMAARLRRASGAQLSMHAVERAALARHSTRLLDLDEALGRLECWGVPEARRAELAQYVDRSPEGLVVAVDRDLQDGEQLPVPGFGLVAMSTPGHTAGHLCLRDDERRLILTGDHVLPTVFPGLGLGGPTSSNPLSDYVRSVAALAPFGDYEVLPGHGFRFTGLAERATECAEHHLTRARQVDAVLGEPGPERSVWEIASRLTWTAGWEGLHGFQLLSALNQTEMHRDFVRAGGLSDG